MGRRVLGYSLAVFAVLLPANVLFVMLRRPDVTETARAIRQHNWKHAQCEDITDNCAAWTKRGMCRWDRTTQRLCRSSCDRCDVGAHESIHSVPVSLSLPAYTAVAQKMEIKVATALASPALAKSLDLIGHLNNARLSDAKIDPRTCQRSEVHSRGQALMHDFLGSLSRAASMQDACRFDMLPVLPSEQCRDEAPDCPAGEAACRGPHFAKMVHQCRKTCGFCLGGCEDTDKQRCPAWAKDGQCARNMAFMLESCADSCGTCRQLHDPNPPHFVVLWNGLLMPSIGFGTAGLGAAAYDAVALALRAGYRHIDSAQAPEWYREDLNAKALAESGVPREQVFITSKVHPRHFGFNTTLSAVASTLKVFNTSYIDLMLLHYPGCWGTLCGDNKPEGTWRESWRALEQLVKDGMVLSIGVSNFGIPELVNLLSWAIVPPAVVQRNSDVFSQDKVMHRLCLSLGIRYEAYSSLGTQYLSKGYTSSPVLSHPAVQAIAAVHGSSAAQVVLSYALTMGQIVLPRSKQQKHMEEALQSPQTRLSYEELLLLANLDHHLPAL